MKELFTFVLLLSYFNFGAANCYNRHRQPGSCVPLSTCPDFNQYSRPQRDDVCGFSGWDPNVCCTGVSSGTIQKSNLPQPGSGECGIDSSDKIFGGTETKLDELPWLALLQYRKHDGTLRFQCGGVLISSRYVLTAGHCIRSDYTLTLVRLGEWNLDTNPDCDLYDCADPAQDISVERIIRHPDYNLNGNEHNDIALLRLSSNANINYFVKPICLPSVSELRSVTNDAGKNFVVAGWGRTETRSQSNKKLKVEVKGLDLEICKTKYLNAAKRRIIAKQLCAGGEAGKDSCQGDSGGPLIGMYNDGRGNNYHYLAGLVSYGPKNCGTPGFPGVYTRVASYIDWIEANVKP